MKSLLRFLLLLPLCLSLATVSLAQDNRKEAEKAWQALVRTKGGREKLYSISNLLTQYSNVTELNVMPCSFQWRFTPALDGSPTLQIYNASNNVEVIASRWGVQPVDKHDFADECQYRQIPFLLETKWYQPTPLSIRREKDGKRSVDVLKVAMDDARLEFVFEPEIMLVSEVRFLFQDGTPWQKYRFSDYVDVDGIKMPSTFKISIGAENFSLLKKKGMPIKFAFNVDYDPKIFDPPFMATTADAWKRRAN